uniref:Uncharacterized protein n=1 Tax=Glossina austeni TaxID=7395 RepID=A0A1A9VN69_GLOAU
MCDKHLLCVAAAANITTTTTTTATTTTTTSTTTTTTTTLLLVLLMMIFHLRFKKDSYIQDKFCIRHRQRPLGLLQEDTQLLKQFSNTLFTKSGLISFYKKLCNRCSLKLLSKANKLTFGRRLRRYLCANVCINPEVVCLVTFEYHRHSSAAKVELSSALTFAATGKISMNFVCVTRWLKTL